MALRPVIIDPIYKALGPALFVACQEDNVPQVESITSNNKTSDWTHVLVAAGREGATNVAAYAMARGGMATGSALEAIVTSSGSEPVYRQLIETKTVDVNYVFELYGEMLGYCASKGNHDLAEFLLEHGACPDSHDQTHAFRTTLASAAAYSDERMVQLLLDYGARIPGSGALAFAAEQGKLKNVQLLLAHGADVNEVGHLEPEGDPSVRKIGTGKPRHISHSTNNVTDFARQHCTLQSIVFSLRSSMCCLEPERIRL